MFGVGFFELVIIGVVALVFIGPKRLPEVMKQAGRLFVHVRRTANDVRSTFDQVIRDAEAEIHREEAEAFRKALKPVVDLHAEVKAMVAGGPETLIAKATAPSNTVPSSTAPPSTAPSSTAPSSTALSSTVAPAQTSATPSAEAPVGARPFSPGAMPPPSPPSSVSPAPAGGGDASQPAPAAGDPPKETV